MTENMTGQQTETRPCWFPNCPNPVPQEPNGRPKLTCDLVVDGLRHSRMNKSLAQRGKIQVPPRGGGPTSASVAPVSPAGQPSEQPVTRARQTMGQLMGEVQAAVTGLAPLVRRMEEAARVVADQEQVAAEIAATERRARADVDQAEAERDQAASRARQLEAERDAASTAQRLAEEAAETALEGEELAQEQQARAERERDTARAAERGQRDRAEGAEAARDEALVDLARSNERTDNLLVELTGTREALSQTTAELARVGMQRDAAEDARQTTEVRAAELGRQLSEAREQLASRTAQLDSAREAIERERQHADQRVNEQRQEYEARLTDQRTAHDTQVGQLTKAVEQARAVTDQERQRAEKAERLVIELRAGRDPKDAQPVSRPRRRAPKTE